MKSNYGESPANNLPTTVIEASCVTKPENLMARHSYGNNEYAMKYVLLTGLQRKNELCDLAKLSKLLKDKSFFVKDQHSSIDHLLQKIKKNIAVFTVNDIHGIIRVPDLGELQIIKASKQGNKMQQQQHQQQHKVTQLPMSNNTKVVNGHQIAQVPLQPKTSGPGHRQTKSYSDAIELSNLDSSLPMSSGQKK